MITPVEALRLIAVDGCEVLARPHKFTDPPACFGPASGHWLYATYGAETPCPSCTARLALIAAGEPADELSLRAEVGPQLPDMRYTWRCIERGARWDPAVGWTAPPAPGDRVVDLMTALEDAVAAVKAARTRHPQPADR